MRLLHFATYRHRKKKRIDSLFSSQMRIQNSIVIFGMSMQKPSKVPETSFDLLGITTTKFNKTLGHFNPERTDVHSTGNNSGTGS